MVLNSRETEKLFKEEFKIFKNRHDKLAKYANSNKSTFDDIIPRKLRMFRVRLRLVIGLKIDFDTQYSMVKNKPTADTYVEIIKCNESWFSYEGMKKYCESENWNKADSNTPVDIFDANMMNSLQTNHIQSICNNQLNEKILKTASFKTDIISYLDFLVNNLSNGAVTLKRFISQAQTSFNQNPISLNHIHIFSIIYGTRNIFVHRGESAKSGVKYYRNKIALLKILYDFMILFQLKTMNYSILNQMNKYNIK